MGERMEVEAVCGWQPCGRCSYPASDSFWMTCPVVEGSLTEARLRLADAAEALDQAERAWEAVGRQLEDCPQAFAWLRASEKYDAELAALRTKRAGG